MTIGTADCVEAIWWLAGHFWYESDLLLATQLLLLACRVGLLFWVAKLFPMLAYL